MRRAIAEVADPKGKDELRFKKRHITIKHRDRNGNGDDMFQATNIKTVDRSEGDYKHGYDLKQSDAVYEGRTVRTSDYTTSLVLGPDGRVHRRRTKQIIKVGDAAMTEEFIDESSGTKSARPIKVPGLFVDKNGTKYWRNSQKQLHREDGPAVEYPGGTKFWMQNGGLHRIDGPAVINSNGTKKWYLDGNQYTAKSHAVAVKGLKESLQTSKGVSPNRPRRPREDDYAPYRKPKSEWDRSKRTIQGGKSLRDIVGRAGLEEGVMRKIGGALAAGAIGAAAMAGVGALKNRGPSFYDRTDVYNSSGNSVGWKDNRISRKPRSWRDTPIFGSDSNITGYRDNTVHESDKYYSYDRYGRGVGRPRLLNTNRLKRKLIRDKDTNKDWYSVGKSHINEPPARKIEEAIIHNVPLVPMMKSPKIKVDWLDKPKKIKVRFLDRDKRSPDRIGEESEINELSSDTLRRYRDRVAMDAVLDPPKGRLKGLRRAHGYGKAGAKILQREESEINELSKATLGRYLTRAGWSAKWNGSAHGDARGANHLGLGNGANRRARNRANGIARVGIKLQKAGE